MELKYFEIMFRGFQGR